MNTQACVLSFSVSVVVCALFPLWTLCDHGVPFVLTHVFKFKILRATCMCPLTVDVENGRGPVEHL